jgi:hypothetical protein
MLSHYGRCSAAIIGLLLVNACAQTQIRPVAQVAEHQLPPPARILIRHFAINEKVVTEYQGIMRQQPSNPNVQERQRLIADKASNTLADRLTDGLRQLGFSVELARRSVNIGKQDLVIDGRFLNIDEGNPLRRTIFGFGSGAAAMETRVRAFYGGGKQKVLEFITQADSGQLPGAVATAPATVAAPVTLGVGIALSKGLQADLTSAEQMAAASAEQAVRFLSEFFARQGWIAPSQVRKARMATR